MLAGSLPCSLLRCVGSCRAAPVPSPKSKGGQASMSAYLKPLQNPSGGLDLQPTQRIKKPSDSMAARRCGSWGVHPLRAPFKRTFQRSAWVSWG